MSRNMSNIFLVALAKTSDLKNYGFDPILQKIVADLCLLETEGIEVRKFSKHIISLLTVLLRLTSKVRRSGSMLFSLLSMAIIWRAMLYSGSMRALALLRSRAQLAMPLRRKCRPCLLKISQK
jgi:hypothetical protein